MGSRCLGCGDIPPWKKAKVMDLFGPWEQYDGLKLETAACASVPSVRVPRADVLLVNVELDSNSQIPFSAVDALRTVHGIDVSAISLSLTHRGNIYGAHALKTASMRCSSHKKRAVNDRHAYVFVCSRAVNDRHHDVIVYMSAVNDRDHRATNDTLGSF